MSLRELLKKNRAIRSFAKYIRRSLFNSKYLYFISGSSRPLSDQYGFDRGTPLDRYYIESFLTEFTSDIKGDCLELLSNEYTLKYGRGKVTRSDVLDILSTNKQANIIDDLRNLKSVDDDTYDTIILTQVLQFIDDLDAAISECHRILKPDGTLLVTLPCISRADCTSGISGDFWRFTQASAEYLFQKKFPIGNITINNYGNARSGIYFYAGLAVEDTPLKILNTKDADFPTIVTVRATK